MSRRVALSPAPPGDEVCRTLHRRLRFVVPGIFLVCLFYLGRNLGGSTDPMPARVGGLVQGSLLGALLIAALPLYAGGRLSLATLRAVEGAVFAVATIFLCWRHGCTLFEAWELKAAQPAQSGVVLRLALGTAAARWLLLIVVYGLTIPNTTRRCAAIVFGMAAIPLGISFAIGGEVPLPPPLAKAMVQMAALLFLGAGLATFACYRLNRQPAAVLEGETLGPYRLVRRLRAGGMGEVFLAEHLVLGRRCAVKRILPQLARDERMRRRFDYEARVLARVRHPNVVTVFDAGQTDDGTCYYVMEYLEGATLGELATWDGPLPPARVVELTRQAAEALHAVHLAGLLHLDVTPSNLLLTGATVQLVDFGLARSYDPAGGGRRGSVFGAPGYMAPEQASGGLVDPRSDVYSLGAVAYYLLTGAPPFVRDGVLPTLLAHAFDGPEPPSARRPDVPADLETIVLRCLRKEPDERFGSARAVAEALAACTTSPPSSTAAEATTLTSARMPTPTELPVPCGLVFTPIPEEQLTADAAPA